MNTAQDQLQYLNESYSQTEISRLTGIPQSTLSYVIRGIRVLPSQYTTSLTSVYRDVAYSNLFNAGSPSLDASLTVLESPEAVREREAYINSVAEHLTMGYVEAMAISENDGVVDQAFIDEIWDEAYRDIQQSLRSATKPVSEWDDYMAPEA